MSTEIPKTLNLLDPTPPAVIAPPVRTNLPDVVVPGTPPQAPSVGAAPVVPPVVSTQPSVSGGAGTAPSSVVLSADTDDIPENAELLSLSRKGLESRLARHTRKELRERFGTDNSDEIVAKLKRLDEFEKRAEEQRLASLSELEREHERATKAEERANAAEERVRAIKDAQDIGQAHTRIGSIAAQHLKPKIATVIIEQYREHLRTMSEAEIDALTDEQIGAWFADQVKETPEFGKSFVLPAAPQTVPLSNGANAGGQPPPAPPPPPGAPTNYSPSAPNALSPQEARKQAAKDGYSW